MEFSFNVFSLILISSGLLTLYLSFTLLKKLGGAIYSFGYIMLAIALWAISYGIELSFSSLQYIMSCINVEYLGIVSLPSLWVIFVFKFTGKDSWVNVPSLIALFIIPAITLGLVWTNQLHNLHYLSLSVVQVDNHYFLDIGPGPWYRIFTLYFYVMLLIGISMLVVKARTAQPIYRRQYFSIIAAALIPWFVNLMYLLGYRPFGHIDLTPFAFIITSLIIAISLLRYQLFDIKPVAREKVMEAMQEGVLVVDKHERIVDANGKMMHILGASAKTLIGKEFLNLPFVSAEPALFDPSTGYSRVTVVIDNKNYSITITPLYETNRYDGRLFLFRDITERMHVQERLESLNMLKDRLFSVISHDLRSPLNTLVSIVSLANEGHVSDAELKTMLPELSKNLGYTTGLVNNLLQWSKSQLKGEVILPVRFDVNEMVKEVTQVLQHMANDKHVRIVNKIQPGIMAYADEDMIQGVIRNLLSNAIKFARHDGEIELTAITEANMVTVCVADNGVGMNAQDMSKLFGVETFTTRGTENEKGTGLGLVLSKDFIEKNGGHIWAESEPGKGSRFYFVLPMPVVTVQTTV